MKRASKGGAPGRGNKASPSHDGNPLPLPPYRDDQPAERREAMFAAVDEVVDSIGDWLHEDMTILDRPIHNYGRGDYLSRQLVTLVALLIEADRACGGTGHGDENEFRS